MTSDSLICKMLQYSLDVYCEKLEKIYTLITCTPEQFLSGQIFEKVISLCDAVKAVSYSLITIFFLFGLLSYMSTVNARISLESAIKILLRFSLAKALVDFSDELTNALCTIASGITEKVFSPDASGAASLCLPEEIVNAAEECSFLESVPLFAVALISCIIIFALSIRLVLIVYGRFFKIYLYMAVAPIPLASFASELTSQSAVKFLKSFAAVCFEGTVIAICLMIFSYFTLSVPDVSSETSAMIMVMKYCLSVIFNMMILSTMVSGAENISKELIL